MSLNLLVPFHHRHSYLILSPHMKFSFNRASFLLALLTISMRSLSDFVLFWCAPFSFFSRRTSSSLFPFFVLCVKFNKRNGTRHQKCPKQYMDLWKKKFKKFSTGYHVCFASQLFVIGRELCHKITQSKAEVMIIWISWVFPHLIDLVGYVWTEQYNKRSIQLQNTTESTKKRMKDTILPPKSQGHLQLQEDERDCCEHQTAHSYCASQYIIEDGSST